MIDWDKISTKQLCFLVILTQVGVHVLTIPYGESRYSGYDSWISILLGGAIAQAGILVIYFLAKRHADRPLPEYIFTIVGKPLGSVLNVMFAAYFVESTLMIVVSYSDVINRWVLFKTPWSVITGLMILIAAYVASSSLRSIATVTETCIYMFLVCIAIVLISGTGRGDFRHLLPIGTHGAAAIGKDALPAFWAYAGYELLLYVFPFVKYRCKKDVLITMSVANGLTTVFYVLIAIIVTHSFSESQLNTIPEPMIYILHQFRWPIVQSLDILFMTIWLGVTSITAYVYLFLSARHLAFSTVKEIRNHPLLVWILAIACFVVGLWGNDRRWLLRFTEYHKSSTAVVVVLVPVILLLASLIRKKAV